MPRHLGEHRNGITKPIKKEAFKRLTEIYHKKGIENLGVLGSLTIKEKP